MRTVAIIPARGGSNGLKRKNIRLLGNKPLIAYSIEAALASRLIERVIVSTEDEEIARVSVEHGAEVPFLRPDRLAKDDITAGQVINHAIPKLYGSKAKQVVYVTLYPTSPFRPKGLIDLLVGKVLDGHRQATTVKPVAASVNAFRKIAPGKDEPCIMTRENGSGLCDGTYFRPYGLAHVDRFDLTASRLPSYYHVITDKSCLIDIDYQEDILLAETVLENNLFDFEKSHAQYCPHQSS